MNAAIIDILPQFPFLLGFKNEAHAFSHRKKIKSPFFPSRITKTKTDVPGRLSKVKIKKDLIAALRFCARGKNGNKKNINCRNCIIERWK